MPSSRPRQQKNNASQAKSSGKMRLVYILVLLLMIFSLFARVSGARSGATWRAGGATAARVLVFHHKEGSLCEDLAISAAGNAIFSNCAGGTEKQYSLNDAERSQLQSWIDVYSPIDYDDHGQAQAGDITTQLYLNGRGKQQADPAEIPQIVDFAAALSEKIAAKP